MFAYLSIGFVFGLSAGFSPGPLLTLVITQTFKHGLKEGIKVALAPLLSDLPIILLAAILLTQFVNSKAILGAISLMGGLFVLYLAYESFHTPSLDTNVQLSESKSMTKGALVNALSPHPYLFWLTVGVPMMSKAWTESALSAAAFVMGFYVCLIGAKITLAIVTSHTRQFLTGKTYGIIIRILGMLLLVFAIYLFKDGIDLIGIKF